MQDYKLLTKINLLRWTDVSGLKVYSSILGSAFRTKAHKERGSRKDAFWVYNFKKSNDKADEVRFLVETVAAHFDCTDIVAIPSSSTETNNLQRLFGETIKRIKAVPTRKNAHKKPLPADYGESYIVEKEAITGNKVLLVDDICATGTTLGHFADRFTSEGYEVVKLALGLDYKLPIEPAETIVVYSTQTQELFDIWDKGEDISDSVFLNKLYQLALSGNEKCLKMVLQIRGILIPQTRSWHLHAMTMMRQPAISQGRERMLMPAELGEKQRQVAKELIESGFTPDAFSELASKLRQGEQE